MEGACFSTINPDGKEVNAECVKKNTFPDTWDDELWSFINIGSQCEKRGLPFSVGWAEHPAYLIDIIDLYDSEVALYRSSNK